MPRSRSSTAPPSNGFFYGALRLLQLYLLAMLDYISRENDVPLCDEYDDIRRCRLENTIYPASVLALSAAAKKEDALRHAELTSIPEFKRFNIIESEIRNVI